MDIPHSSTSSAPLPKHLPVARVRHTIVLLAIMAALAAAGAAYQGAPQTAHAAPRPSVFALYLPLLVSEWLMFWYVWARGLRPAGVPLRELIGARWRGPADVLRDLALGVLLWGAWRAIELAWNAASGTDTARSVAVLLPRGLAEGVLWSALACTAGFVEEVVYRGYLQRQFAAWTQRPALALVLQALVFGLSHGYQGVAACARIAVFGLLFGLVARWRRSLAPGMMAHALTDLVAGLLRTG